ncbi:hypothetical protein Droror1_Dr00015832 [Drosera rotundifolia]
MGKRGRPKKVRISTNTQTEDFMEVGTGVGTEEVVRMRLGMNVDSSNGKGLNESPMRSVRHYGVQTLGLECSDDEFGVIGTRHGWIGMKSPSSLRWVDIVEGKADVGMGSHCSIECRECGDVEEGICCG